MRKRTQIIKASLGYYNKFYPTCSHWRQPVRVGRYVVTCSSALYTHDNADPKPDFGLYLDKTTWETRLSHIWTNGSYLKSVAEKRSYPALVMDWMDGSAPNPQLLTQLVNIALSKLRHGKRIDIGCIGGHGRTGTLLACLIARVEHLSARAAIEQVRQRYCRLTVENKSQEEAVERYVANMGIRVKGD